MNIYSFALPFLFVMVIGTFILIFKDYIKKNKLSLSELFKMFLDYFVTYCMLTVGYVVATKIMIAGIMEMEARNERIVLILTSAVMFGLLTFYAIGYLRSTLDDGYTDVVRHEVKRGIRFGSVILFVGEIILMLSPFILIPRAFVNYTDDKTFMFDFVLAIVCSLIGMFLFYFENPFRDKLERDVEIVVPKKSKKRKK